MGVTGDYGSDVDRAGYMYFDWDKAAGLIKAAQPVKAYAKLNGDQNVPGTEIWVDGALNVPVGVRVNLASEHAIPMLEMIMTDGSVSSYDCWRIGQPGTMLGGYWPASARARLA